MTERNRKQDADRSNVSTTKNQSVQRREPRRSDVATRDQSPYGLGLDPLNMMRRFTEQMDRWFGEVGTERDWWARQTGRQGGQWMWSPAIETIQRGDQLVVRAELPGLKKDNVNVEVTDEAITIQGERRDEHEEEREGYYRTERSYGSFYRVIPLPDGAIPESAKAQFKDGVLEVTVQAPPREVSHGRRIEISEGRQTEGGQQERSSTQSER